jgi:hypothetical protein
MSIYEEFYFRWLVLFCYIISIQILNFIFLGFIPYFLGKDYEFLEIIRHIYCFVNYVFNLMSLENLSWLYEKNWVVCSAALMSTSIFQFQHQYSGFISNLNLWIGSLFLFWVTFNYGILFGIIIHILYNLTVISTYLLIAKVEK